MSLTIKQIVRELGVSKNDIISFLRDNGFTGNVSNKSLIPNDLYELLIANQIRLADPTVVVKKTKEVDLSELPFEVRIATILKREKKLAERILGYIEYTWNYNIITFNGTCAKPLPFDEFDEVITEILLIKNGLSLYEIGIILGMNTDHNIAEKNILLDAIISLKKFQMVEGDESFLCLTEMGREFCVNKVKPSTYNKEFDLYFDVHSDQIKGLKNIFNDVPSGKSDIGLEYSVDFDMIKSFAEVQAQEIHFPQRNFQLQEAVQKSAQSLQTSVWVCFLQSIQNEEIHASVYIDSKMMLYSELSEYINSNIEIKESLLKEALSNQNIEFLKAIEAKDDIQQAVEKELIEQQQEVEIAIKNKEKEKASSIISNKKLFDSLEFEVELQRLFSICDDELWLISPWIRDNAFNVRGPMIEDFLQRGGKVFIAYSEDDGVKQGDKPMADEHSQNQILKLEETYKDNFFFTQLKPFHVKNVLSKFKENTYVGYTGSFNVLSISFNTSQQQIRKEEMTRFDWNDEAVVKYKDYKTEFARKYFDQAILMLQNKIDNVNTISLTELKSAASYTPPRLKYFVESEIPDIKILSDKYEDCRDDISRMINKVVTETELEAIRALLSADSVTNLQKVEYQNRLSIIKQSDDSFYLKEKIDEVQLLLDSIQISKVFEKREWKNSRIISLPTRDPLKVTIDVTLKSIALKHYNSKVIESEKSLFLTLASLNYLLKVIKEKQIESFIDIKKAVKNILNNDNLFAFYQLSFRESERDPDAVNINIIINNVLFTFNSVKLGSIISKVEPKNVRIQSKNFKSANLDPEGILRQALKNIQ